jgi:hypothetical protein
MLRMILILICSITLMGCAPATGEWGWSNKEMANVDAGIMDGFQECTVVSDEVPERNYDRLTRYSQPMRANALPNGKPRTPHHLDRKHYPTPAYNGFKPDLYGVDRDRAFGYCMLDKDWEYQKKGADGLYPNQVKVEKPPVATFF